MKHYSILIVTIIASLTLFGCGGKARKVEVPKHSVISKNCNAALKKCSFKVKIDSELEEKDIERIAYKIKRENKGISTMFILYYVDKPYGIAYASSHFTPELKVKIINASKNAESESDSVKKSIKPNNIISEWRSISGIATHLIFFKKDGKTLLKTTYNDGSGSEEELLVNQQGSSTIYKIIGNDYGEGYELVGNKLYSFDKDGRIAEFKKK